MNQNCSPLGPLAQLVRALPCHGRGHEFKSRTDRKAGPGVLIILLIIKTLLRGLAIFPETV